MSYQLTCPNCRYEFAYDRDYYDKHIAELGVEIQDISRQLQEHNLLPYREQRLRTDWWRRAKLSLTTKQKELAELKAIRKVAEQHLSKEQIGIFKQLVKDELGEERYVQLMEQARLELKAYKISDTMGHGYTRSNSKSSVTSINKL